MKAPLKLILILIALLIACSGCSTIGVKKETTIVYVQLGQHDEAFDGLIRVATNKPIEVTVGEEATKFDAGGYYVVHEQDLKAFRDEIKRLKGLSADVR